MLLAIAAVREQSNAAEHREPDDLPLPGKRHDEEQEADDRGGGREPDGEHARSDGLHRRERDREHDPVPPLKAGQEVAHDCDTRGRGGAGGGAFTPPGCLDNASFASSAMPPSAPNNPADSIGIMNTFWFGEVANSLSASTHFCATK